jgi:hypothetical protein
MTTLEAHEYFARRGSDHDIFPHDVKLRGYPGCDIWPAACVAAVGLAGHLNEALVDKDLDAGIDAYERYVSMGCLNDDALEEATLDVIGQLLEWGESQERAGRMECDTDRPAG